MGASHNAAGRVSSEMADRIMQLHERDKLNYATIAERLNVTARTVSRTVKRVIAAREKAKQTA